MKSISIATIIQQKRYFATAVFLGAAFFSNIVFAQGWKVENYGKFGLPDPQGGIAGIITNLLNWLLLVFGFIAIIGFVISGILYLTAAGDEDQQKKAKRAMFYSIIGVVVGLVGLVIIQQVDAFLNAKSQGGGATPSVPSTPGANDPVGA